MAWTYAGLSRAFGSDGAFILRGCPSANVRNRHSLPTVERSARGHPIFHIIPCTCLQGMETQEDEPHLQSVLMVSKELYGSPAMADRVYLRCRSMSQSDGNQVLSTSSLTTTQCKPFTLKAWSWLNRLVELQQKCGSCVSRTQCQTITVDMLNLQFSSATGAMYSICVSKRRDSM
jgi:hypothetical protein